MLQLRIFKFSFLNLLLSFALASLSFLFFSGNVFAISVVSPVVEIEANPGESVTGILKLFNETSEVVFLQSSVESFTSDEVSGKPVFIPEEESGEYLRWINLSQEELLIQPKQLVIVPFELDVPDDAVPGGYYSVVFWQATSDDSDKQVSIGAKIGTLILLKVNGDINESGSVTDFRVTNNSPVYEFPVNFSLTFQNQGNVHLSPRGKITLTNFLGQKHVIEINPSHANVLPQSSRVFNLSWESSSASNWLDDFTNKTLSEIKTLAIGPYTADLDISFGTEKVDNYQASTNFIVVPVRSLSILLVLLMALIIILRINKKINKLKKDLKKNVAKPIQK